jgi:hypothetical protein
MIAQILSALLVGSAQSIAYTLCDATNHIYAGKEVTTALVLGPSMSVTIGGAVRGVSIKGTITVLDGCTVSYW